MSGLTVIAAVGVLAVLTHASRDWDQFLRVSSHGVLVAGASALIGGLTGFLFGIPRTQQGDEATPANEHRPVAYRPNTNLEQISDWLTKILVGIGLIQLGRAPEQLGRLAEALGPGFGGGDGAESLALTVVLYFSLIGFLFGYLWTRLFLPGAFRTADLDVIDRRISERVDEQNARDVRALTLVDRQLSPDPGAPPLEDTVLIDAIKAASTPVRVQIFQKAQEVRASNWRNNPEKMELVIPIFRALIAADVGNRFHRNHAQLAYALKDKSPPDWRGAQEELDKAIEIRGDWRTAGWLFYEFNRAICRIAQDPLFQNRRPSNASERAAIVDDLRAAAQSDHLYRIIIDDRMIVEWLNLNDITPEQLRS